MVWCCVGELMNACRVDGLSCRSFLFEHWPTRFSPELDLSTPLLDNFLLTFSTAIQLQERPAPVHTLSRGRRRSPTACERFCGLCPSAVHWHTSAQ